MPFRRFRDRVVDRAVGLTALWETGPTTRSASAMPCVSATSCPCSQCAIPDIGWLGRWRWVVERTFAWLNQFRRIRVRYERRADIHEAFLSLACVLICWNFLRCEIIVITSGNLNELISSVNSLVTRTLTSTFCLMTRHF